MDWKLWYEDRAPFSSEDGSWIEAPPRGVVALLYPDATGRTGHRVDSGEVYIWPPWRDFPCGADTWGLMDYLLKAGVLEPDQLLHELSYLDLVEAGVKLGRTLPDDDWYDLRERLWNDPDFGVKSTALPGEREPW